MIRARGDQPRKTIEDFMSLPEGTRAELIDGELFRSPSPRPTHQQIVRRLVRFLDNYLLQYAVGEIYFAPCDVHLPSEDVVQPDILFIASPNLGIVQDWIRGVPDLIIEVISPDAPKRDRIIKRDLYAHNGVREYWIVDPAAETIETLSLRGSEYERSGYFEVGETLTSPLLSELQVPLAAVFEDLR